MEDKPKDWMWKPMLRHFVKRITGDPRLRALFSGSDRILVGISGGKDSLLLLEVLGEIKIKLNQDFEIIPVHIHLTEIGYSIDMEFLEGLCDHYGTSLRVIKDSLTLDETGKKSPCFLCSWHRRKLLFELSKELKCNKLALGHHRDDAIQTLMMNMIYHGSISSIPLSLSMFEGRLELIRPLLFLGEQEIIQYRNVRQYPELFKNCPYGDDTRRSTMENMIAEMQNIHPQARINIFNAMAHIYTSYLPVGNQAVVSGLNVIHPPATKQEDPDFVI